MIKNKILNNSGLKYYKILRFYGGRKIPFVLLLSAVASLAEGIGFIVVIAVLNHLLGFGIQSDGMDLSNIAKLMIFLTTKLSIEGIIILAVFVFFFKASIVYLLQSTLANLRGDLLMSLRSSSINALVKMKYDHFLDLGSGHLSNLFGEQISRSLHAFKSLASAFICLTASVAFLSSSLFVSPIFGLAAIFCGAIIWVSFSKLTKNIKNSSINLAQKNTDLASNVIQLVRTFKYLKSTLQLNSVGSSIKSTAMNLTKSQKKIGNQQAIFISLREPILISFVFIVVYILVKVLSASPEIILVSAILFYKGLGQLMAFQTAWMVSMETAGSLEFSESSIKEMEKYSDISDENNFSLFNTFGYDLSGVSFKTPNNQIQILDNINMKIKAGTSLAIIGPSGSGKSTLLDILMGIRFPSSGTIDILNVNNKKISTNYILGNVGYLPQEPIIFNDTVFNNLNMSLGLTTEAKENKNFESIKKICSELGVIEQIKKLPQGFDTILKETGSNLSGGQKQRLAFVRELARESSTVLILDEPTSALDSLSEEFMIKYLKSLKGYKTVIMVSHKIESLDWVDEIVMLEAGEIKFQGKYDNLYRS